MSIANLIVQPHAAYLIADSGYFAEDGTVSALAPKILTTNFGAYASTGHGTVWLEAVKRLDITHLAPDAFRDGIKAIYDEKGLDSPADASRYLAAIWSERLQRPLGLSFFTNADDGAPEQRPWIWYPARVILLPFPKPVDVWGMDVQVDIKDPEIFDPFTDSMHIVHAQRAKRAGWLHGDGCKVAGEIHLVEVSAGGVKIFDLHTYPDRVGELAGDVTARNIA